ncbi:MAG: SMC-Scp complex subunit ScpB [Patescibacteria group bacterium]
MSKETNIVAQLEALLFIYGEPLNFKKIAEILECKEADAKDAAANLAEELRKENRGLFLISDKEKIQLSTKPEFGKLLEDVVKAEMAENLTPAALETLAIIAYAGPVSRAEIDYIRGVNSSFILRNLSIRGLTERSLDPKRANAFVYAPSMELLKYLGIARSEDLPEFNKFNELVKKMWNKEETQ